VGIFGGGCVVGVADRKDSCFFRQFGGPSANCAKLYFQAGRPWSYLNGYKNQPLNTTTRVVLGAAAVYALYHVYKLNATGKLNFYPGTVQSIEFVGSSPYLSFTLLVQNTSSVEVTINSLAGNIYSGNTLLGNIFQSSPIVVPANSQASPVITAQLSLVSIVNDLIRAFDFKDFQEKISFEGNANVGGVQIPLDLQFTIGS
jgi:hypothetical protein